MYPFDVVLGKSELDTYVRRHCSRCRLAKSPQRRVVLVAISESVYVFLFALDCEITDCLIQGLPHLLLRTLELEAWWCNLYIPSGAGASSLSAIVRMVGRRVSLRK